MFIVHVFVSVKPDNVDDFVKATIENASNSILKEQGVARFDVVRELDDSSSFVLVEAYYTKEDAARHKETNHYKAWRNTVEDMMASPRRSIKYTNVFPEKEGW